MVARRAQEAPPTPAGSPGPQVVGGGRHDSQRLFYMLFLTSPRNEWPLALNPQGQRS